jgi:hypothetical protein
LLKIAADHYPHIHIVATGSSTLGASRKFRDTLTGRKRDLWLTPMCLPDIFDAKRTDFKHRFGGGLPPFFLPEEHRSAISKNGWMLTGPRTSRSSFVWSGEIPSNDLRSL